MIEIATSPTTTTLVIAGDLDLAERDQFPEIAARVVGLRRQLLVIDMCRVTFMDSTGVAFLMQMYTYGTQDGLTVSLPEPPAVVRNVIEMLGVDALFAQPAHRGAAREA